MTRFAYQMILFASAASLRGDAPMTIYSFSARFEFYDYTETRFSVGQWS
jgi:hypothetical protein